MHDLISRIRCHKHRWLSNRIRQIHGGQVNQWRLYKSISMDYLSLDKCVETKAAQRYLCNLGGNHRVGQVAIDHSLYGMPPRDPSCYCLHATIPSVKKKNQSSVQYLSGVKAQEKVTAEPQTNLPIKPKMSSGHSTEAWWWCFGTTSLGTINIPLQLLGQPFYVTEGGKWKSMLSSLSGMHIVEFVPPVFLM